MRRVLLVLVLVLAAGTSVALAADPASPTASTSAASGVGTGAATLNASVNPSGADTSVSFEYGTSSALGLTTDAQTVQSTVTTAAAVHQPIGGLSPSTTYSFRVVATNAAGTVRGDIRTFKTAAAPRAPVATTGGAVATTRDATTLVGTLDTSGQPTTYVFEYGRTSAYGSSTPVTSVGQDAGRQNVSQIVVGLVPATTYHYRLVATSAAGVARGADRTFTTNADPNGLFMSISPDPARGGRPVTILGRLTGSSIAKRKVELQSAAPGAAFKKLTSATTASDGTVRFTLAALSTATQLRLAAGSVTSAPVTLQVRPTVHLRARPIHGRRVRVSGSVSPTISGTVSIQRRVHGRWVLLRHATLHGSSYAVTLRRRAGLVVRAKLAARSGLLGVSGPAHTVRLR